MLGSEVFRILFTKHFVEMFACICKLLCATQREREVRKIENTFECRHFRSINFRCNDITNKENLRLGMVYNVVNLVGCELM